MMDRVRRAHRRADCALLGALALVALSGASLREIILYADELSARATLPDSVDVTHSPMALAREQHAAEATCLAEAMYYEARGEGADGEQAVAEVVMQRVRDLYYPKTVCGVVYAGVVPRRKDCQFSFACDGSLYQPKDLFAWTRLRILADGILTGEIKLSGLTGRAIAYHSLYVAPVWAETMQKTAMIGNHIFYKRMPATPVQLTQAASDTLPRSSEILVPAQADAAETVSPLPAVSEKIQPEVEAFGAVGDGA